MTSYFHSDSYQRIFTSSDKAGHSLSSTFTRASAATQSLVVHNDVGAAAGLFAPPFPDCLPEEAALSEYLTQRPFMFSPLADDDVSSLTAFDFPSFSSSPPHNHPSPDSASTTSATTSIDSNTCNDTNDWSLRTVPSVSPLPTGHTSASLRFVALPSTSPPSVTHSSSLSSSRSSSPSPVRAPVKRRAVAELSEEERLQRRRAQHRAVDASRRQKENEAIARLHTLIRQQQRCVEGEMYEEAGDEAEDAMEGSRQKTGRLAVLESSIALIEQLTAAGRPMEEASNAKDAQLSRMSSHLHSVAAAIAQQATSSGRWATRSSDGDMAASDRFSHPAYSHSSPYPSQSLPPPYSPLNPTTSSSSTFLSVLPPSTSSYIAHSDRAHTLRCSGLFSFSTLCVAVVTPPGTIIDVNERFLSYTGWRRSDLLYTSFESTSDLPLTPLIAIHQTVEHGCRLTTQLQQYPSAKQRMEAVKRGERRKADCTWRCRMADGTVFQFDSTFWGEWDQPLERGKRRPPDRVVVVYEYDDAVVVDTPDEQCTDIWDEDNNNIAEHI